MNIAAVRFEYFNGHQNMYIAVIGGNEYLANLIPKFDQVITLSPGESIHWGKNEHGIVNFGLWYDDPKKRPGHGGFWSSRASVVGPLIGKRLVHVAINNFATCMTYEAVEKILPEEYHIVEGSYGSRSSETPYYIQRMDGNNVRTISPTTGLSCGYWLGGRPG
jgi:hypothetical protein